MKCPGCSGMENKVIDSRLNKEGTVIRRRRECLSCSDRFTTYEKLERSLPMLIKKDGRREEFDREKVIDGVKKACQKRPVGIKEIEELVAERSVKLNQETQDGVRLMMQVLENSDSDELAEGILDGFWEYNLNPWDTAAGILIAAEANCLVSNIKGESFNIYNDSILVTNKYINKEIIRILWLITIIIVLVVIIRRH